MTARSVVALLLAGLALVMVPTGAADSHEGEPDYCGLFEQPCWTHWFLCHNVGLYHDLRCCSTVPSAPCPWSALDTLR